MAFVAINKFSLKDSPVELKERLFNEKPERTPNETWNVRGCMPGIETIGIGLPNGTIEKIIGKKLTWEDEPVKI